MQIKIDEKTTINETVEEEEEERIPCCCCLWRFIKPSLWIARLSFWLDVGGSKSLTDPKAKHHSDHQPSSWVNETIDGISNEKRKKTRRAPLVGS